MAPVAPVDSLQKEKAAVGDSQQVERPTGDLLDENFLLEKVTFVEKMLFLPDKTETATLLEEIIGKLVELKETVGIEFDTVFKID